MLAKLINYVIQTLNAVATISERIQKPHQNDTRLRITNVRKLFPTAHRIWNYLFLQLTAFYLGNVAHMAKYSSKIIHCSETLISCKARAGAGPYQLQSQHVAEWRVERTDCSVSPFYRCYCKISTSEFPYCLLCECQFIIQMELWHISVKKSDTENKFKRFCDTFLSF